MDLFASLQPSASLFDPIVNPTIEKLGLGPILAQIDAYLQAGIETIENSPGEKPVVISIFLFISIQNIALF